MLLSLNVMAFSKTFTGTISELEDLVINHNGVRINNFMVTEKRTYSSDSLKNLSVAVSIRNKNKKSIHLSIVFIEGHNWAVSLEPSFGLVSAESSDDLSSDIYVTPNTLKKNKKVTVKIVGDF